MIRRASVVLLIAAAACARPAPVTTAPAPAPAEQRRSPQRPHPVPVPANGPRMTAPLPPTAAVGAIHGWRNSAERAALFLQAYRWAGDRLRELAAREPRGSWAVIMDADETVLDNSTYQFRRNPQGEGYSAESWTAWVNEEAAPATPGAPEFTRLVHELGGRVAIVTNRDEPTCPQTRGNLRKVAIVFDVVLCRVAGRSDKNPRFEQVRTGTGTGLPPLKVVMWVGDNIQDFPGMTQAVRTQPASALAEFGRTYILLPNPMYGSWEGNPFQ